MWLLLVQLGWSRLILTGRPSFQPAGGHIDTLQLHRAAMHTALQLHGVRFRIERLQQRLRKEDTPADCVLFVLGIDGRFNTARYTQHNDSIHCAYSS